MTLKRYIRGYDKAYETLKVQQEIPADRLPMLHEMIGHPDDDPDLFDPHSLSRADVRRLANSLGITMDENAYDYFAEAEKDWKTVANMRDALHS
jgi:hypothetical protein